MMRGRLQVIFDSALATVVALLFATTLAPSVYAQATRQQTRDGSTRPPSSATQSARAQTREGQTSARAEESGVEPDVSITARVTAISLRFEKVPNPKVEFTGRPRRVVDRSGNIVERTLDTAGTVVNQRTVGSVTSLTQQGADTSNASGQTVRRVLDTTGAIIELTLDQAGRVINSRVVSQATGRP
jgi:hypothetical protein